VALAPGIPCRVPLRCQSYRGVDSTTDGLKPEQADELERGSIIPIRRIPPWTEISSDLYIIKIASRIVSFGNPTPIPSTTRRSFLRVYIVPTDMPASDTPAPPAAPQICCRRLRALEAAVAALLANRIVSLATSSDADLWINDGGFFNKAGRSWTATIGAPATIGSSAISRLERRYRRHLLSA